MTSQRLPVGTVLRTDPDGGPCEVGDLIASGGQGEVYHAELGGRTVALKWYYDAHATAYQWRSLERLVASGAPDGRFLWPQGLASRNGSHSGDGEAFGYVMPLRESRFRGLADLLACRINPRPRLSALATVGFGLADSYRKLHSRGLAYRDISGGNAFFDPVAGDVAICDNDNVSVDGQPAGINGTPGYMAPEIVLGVAAPSRETDLWSLAVLLFYLFMNGHPLIGKAELSVHCLDPAAQKRLFGERPVFIQHPTNDSNRPVPGVHSAPIARWPVYPAFLRELFTRTFTEGATVPNARTTESEWQQALIRLRDLITACRCDRENFFDATRSRQACISCGATLPSPVRIRLGTSPTPSVVVLRPGTVLYPHHLDDHRRYDFGSPVAELVENPNRPGLWGLRNLGDRQWTFPASDGTARHVVQGQTVPLTDGRRIDFGAVEGVVRA